LILALALAAGQPSFTAQGGRVVAIVLPAELLADRDVQRQLGSGLTTTFVLVARQRDGAGRGAARIEIRFDPWDEVWFVHRIGVDGKEERQKIASRESLEKWWSAPLAIFAGTADRVALNVVLTVLPFSTAEGEDARRWIGAGAGAPLVAALIGTTLDAKPIRSWRWQAEVDLR
jgi:hypothetical protein